MAVISTFCKKGGVGKSTFVGYMAHYYASMGKKVLIISADDQNSIFRIFGVEDDGSQNYLEFLFAKDEKLKAELGDVLIEARENLYLIKTLNTDKMSINLTQERRYEKEINKMINEYSTFFDYIFIDYPPSSNRLTEVLLDISDCIICVVGLDALGLDGFFNTIQYFVDIDIDLNKIKYIIPNGYSKIKRAPKQALNVLKKQAADFTPQAMVTTAIEEKATVKNVQTKGISPFDTVELDRYDQKEFNNLKKSLLELLKEIKI